MPLACSRCLARHMGRRAVDRQRSLQPRLSAGVRRSPERGDTRAARHLLSAFRGHASPSTGDRNNSHPAENACSLVVPAAFVPEVEAQKLDPQCIFPDDVYRKPDGTIDRDWSPRSLREKRHLTLSKLVQITYPNFPADEGQKNLSELQLAHDASGNPVAVVLQTIHHDRQWQPDGVLTYSVFRWQDIAAQGVALSCRGHGANKGVYLRGEPLGPAASRIRMSMRYLYNGATARHPGISTHLPSSS